MQTVAQLVSGQQRKTKQRTANSAFAICARSCSGDPPPFHYGRAGSFVVAGNAVLRINICAEKPAIVKLRRVITNTKIDTFFEIIRNGNRYSMTECIYNPDYVKGLFNRMSSSYERINFITSFGFSIRWRRQFLKPFKSTTDKIELIDLMTGMGETWGAVKIKFPNAKISALDFSTEMHKSAKRKSERHFDNKVLLLQQDILKSNLPSNYYDFVICAFGLKTFNTEQLQVFASETKRILKAGGQFSFIEVSKPANIFSKRFYAF